MIKSESKPGKITQFSHSVVQIFCPVVIYLALGTCGIQESDVKVKGTAANCLAVASAVVRSKYQSVGIALQDFYHTVEAHN